MDEKQFKDRTRKLALETIRPVERLPRSGTGAVIGRQLVRSATCVGANYRSACRGKSAADMLAKLAIVEEEADESLYWFELLVESGIVHKHAVTDLMDQANEILAMPVASIKTLRQHTRS